MVSGERRTGHARPGPPQSGPPPGSLEGSRDVRGRGLGEPQGEPRGASPGPLGDWFLFVTSEPVPETRGPNGGGGGGQGGLCCSPGPRGPLS